MTAIAAAQFSREAAPDGSFKRQDYVFQGRISADGSTGYPAVRGAITSMSRWPAPGHTARSLCAGSRSWRM